jgi:hypothetical protein
MEQSIQVIKADTDKIVATPSSGMEWFQWVQDFTDKLTFRRILMVLFAGFLITFTTVVFENRAALFQSIYAAVTSQNETASWEISRATQDQLITLVQTSSLIKMAVILDVDLQKNRSIVRFRQLNDPDELEIKRKANAILPQAVFDYDPKNTQQMVGVLNNEFVCAQFQDTSYQRYFPELGKRMPVICSIAIPPFYGRFVGILTLGLNTIPTKQELDGIRIEASRLAVEIYLRDVVKKTGTSKQSSPK